MSCIGARRALYLPGSDIDKVACDRSRRRQCRAHEMGSATLALATFKV
ncbi:MAG: hypothetical protein JWO59_3310, partial [Chloroflexi bacterium]|nr:hypothetical protein [Chloroflexota bacterium]